MLIGAAAREAAMHGMTIQPIFSLFSPHGPVFRTMLRVHSGRRKKFEIDMVGSYSYTGHCTSCGHSQVVPWEDLGRTSCASCHEQGSLALNGPMWVGPMHDVPTLHAMASLADEWGWNDLRPLLETMVNESDPALPPYFIHTHDLSRRAGVSPPPRDRIMDQLRAEGFLAYRSHVERDAIKTDADMATCVAATLQVAEDAKAARDLMASDRSG